MKRILVTGGCGFIGSHTVVELLEAGYEVVVVDNLCNSSVESLNRVIQITKKPDLLKFFCVDFCDSEKLEEVFQQCSPIDAVIHFAGLKSIAESVRDPLLYYRVNVVGTLTLFHVMTKFRCKRLVFSSSAAVYGSAPIPYTESGPAGEGIPNPYGKTKYMIEEVCRDIHMSTRKNKEWSFIILRYFNPIGAHPSGLMGEDPNGVPNNLMPYISQVAVGRREFLTIYGGPGNQPYETADGTGERDYIHVVDLAKGHVAAVSKLLASIGGYCETINLGSGQPVSVLQLVNAYGRACGRPIPYQVAPRRPGDLPSFHSNSSKALKELNWKTERTIEDTCRDAWRWQSMNPNGYGPKAVAPAPVFSPKVTPSA